jgi:hypothetical protein
MGPVLGKPQSLENIVAARDSEYCYRMIWKKETRPWTKSNKRYTYNTSLSAWTGLFLHNLISAQLVEKTQPLTEPKTLFPLLRPLLGLILNYKNLVHIVSYNFDKLYIIMSSLKFVLPLGDVYLYFRYLRVRLISVFTNACYIFHPSTNTTTHTPILHDMYSHYLHSRNYSPQAACLSLYFPSLLLFAVYLLKCFCTFIFVSSVIHPSFLIC